MAAWGGDYFCGEDGGEAAVASGSHTAVAVGDDGVQCGVGTDVVDDLFCGFALDVAFHRGVRVVGVLVNLVQNAAQAGATAIAITTRAAPGDIATVISVADNGPGIPAADRTRVFDPFFTTKDPGRGAGLGLAISLTFAEAMGGTLTAESKPGVGSRFRLWLPRRTPDKQ